MTFYLKFFHFFPLTISRANQTYLLQTKHARRIYMGGIPKGTTTGHVNDFVVGKGQFIVLSYIAHFIHFLHS